ncbi:MAG: zf-HC2 domain-containing protein [Clostridiales bacterium]|jgi:hypothetical protein|nr:zf-HC2 domain-containing protein [Clostridiales bacterium]
MTCEQLQKNIVDYLDGVLAGDALTVAETHLSDCEQCRQEIQELKQALAWIKQAEDMTPPVTLRRNVLTQLEQEARKKRHRFPSWLNHAAAAAAVFMMLVAGNLALQSPMKLASEAPPSVMQEEVKMFNSSANDTEAPEEQDFLRASDSGDTQNYDISSAEADGAHTSTTSVSATGDNGEQTTKRIIPYRILFNLVSIPLFLLLALLTLRKRREAMPNE